VAVQSSHIKLSKGAINREEETPIDESVDSER
jgi:hypothetical protein